MGICSIEIAGFDAMVRSLENALHEGLPGDRTTVRGRLDHVMLSTDPVAPVDPALSWIETELVGLRRRLAMARALEASTPGQQLYVQFDEKDISTKDPAQVQKEAREVAAALKDGDELTEAQIAVLEQGATDPYFTKALADALPPGELAGVVDSLTPSQGAAPGARPDNFSPEMGEDDKRIIDALGKGLGQASFGRGELAPPQGYAQAWLDVITDAENEDGEASKLAMVVSRGTWDEDFLVDLTEGIVEHERDGDKGMWKAASQGPIRSRYVGAVGFDNSLAYDPLALVLQAVGRSPQASMDLFRRSGPTTVTVDGQDQEVSAFMDYLISVRQWPVDEGEAAGEAIMAGATPYEGGDVYSAQVASDAKMASLAFQQEVESRGDDAPWWSSAGHVLLDGLGMVPVVGNVADGFNGIWYYSEGNVLDGSLSMVALVPIAGQGATAGKWGKRVLRGSKAKAVLRNLDNVKLDGTQESVRLLAKADHVSPGVFEFKSLDELNAAANSPHPGVTYRHKDQSWTTDELGRTSRVEGRLRLEPGGRDPGLQRDIGRGPGAKDSDVGFHLIGDALGGPTNRLNVLPGNGKPIDDGLANLNQGEYAKMESSLRRSLKDGSSVDITLTPTYPRGSPTSRPESFSVEAWVDGEPITFGPFINK